MLMEITREIVERSKITCCISRASTQVLIYLSDESSVCSLERERASDLKKRGTFSADGEQPPISSFFKFVVLTTRRNASQSIETPSSVFVKMAA